MFKKFLSLTLMFLVVNLSLSALVFAQTNVEKEAKFVAKVKSELAKFGIGRTAIVNVKLKDGTKLKGYVSQINDDDFVLKDSNTGTPTTISYLNTKQVRGNNLSTGAKIAIGIGIGLGVLALLALIGLHYAD